MTVASKTMASQTKVRLHREQLRLAGLRPVQIWVPDVTAASFRLQAHRQSLAVAQSAGANDDQAFVDSATDWNQE